MSSPCFLLVRVAIETQVPKKHPAGCPRLLPSNALVRGAASWPCTAHPSTSLIVRLGGGVGRRGGGGGDNSQLQFCSAAAAAKSSGLLGTKNPFLLLSVQLINNKTEQKGMYFYFTTLARNKHPSAEVSFHLKTLTSGNR